LCLANGTEKAVRRSDRDAEVSRGHSSPVQSAHSTEALFRKERNRRIRRAGNDWTKARTEATGK
jgi:hypothetical protein